MPLLSLVLMPSRSSSSPRSRDEASRPIDSDVYRDYPNAYIEWLELWKEKVEPEHEYVLIITDKGDKYRIERRPSEGANINSKLYDLPYRTKPACIQKFESNHGRSS